MNKPDNSDRSRGQLTARTDTTSYLIPVDLNSENRSNPFFCRI
jgi:hypothetical protein